MGAVTTLERVKRALRIPVAGVTVHDVRIGEIIDEVESEILETAELGSFSAVPYSAVNRVGPRATPLILLPRFPVTGIVAITVAGSLLPDTQYAWDRSGAIRPLDSGGSPIWWPGNAVVSTTFEAGLVVAGATPGALTRLATLMAARQYLLEPMAGLLRMQVDPIDTELADPTEDAIEREIRRLMARYRRPVYTG